MQALKVSCMDHERGDVTKGQILYRGDRIDQLNPSALVKRGICQVMEGRHCFQHLTVEENLLTGAYTRGALGSGISEDLEKVYSYFPRLKERRHAQAGYTSGGEQQMTAIGRALMARPRTILLDEPSMGLAPLMVAKIFEVVRDIAARGMTILLVEQNALLALEAASRAYVMESGSITLSGEAKTLLHDPRIREAYLGEARSA
jgi:branched-chain amino acid transport system ATP-binding protein